MSEMRYHAETYDSAGLGRKKSGPFSVARATIVVRKMKAATRRSVAGDCFSSGD